MANLTPDFFQNILTIEGGYQNHPADTGNYCDGQLIGTKFGMSAVAISQWWGRCPTVEEVQGLTQTDAFNFYGWYFDRYNLFQIENQRLFELLANNTMGSPANAAKIEQRALNKFGFDVAVDGIRGPETIQALNQAWRKFGPKIYNEIRNSWVQYLKGLNRPEFIQGWLYRMERYFPEIGTTGISLGLALILLLIGYQTFKN